MAHNKSKDDYLDMDKLMTAYTPLMKSIYRRFSSYNNLYHSKDDYDDLESQIQFEFVKLCNEYNPARGVDFPGYIKFHLQQRVYHRITKLQRIRQKEVSSHTKSGDEDSDNTSNLNDFSNVQDMESEYKFELVEAIANLDWSLVKNKENIELIRDVLFNHKSLEEIAAEEGVNIKIIRNRLTSACEELIASHKEIENLTDEQFKKLKQESMKKPNRFFNKVRIPIMKRKPIVTRRPITGIRVPIKYERKM